ncbi:MAG: lysophospholipid acyltransferase family protein [Ktedonobacteraceae bacterium]|nr:lysophospholipid acyltransferase family protein [Chloroflexota bacterium]
MSAVYWLARGGSALAKWTPQAVRHGLGRGVGAGSYLAWRSKRLVTRQNMAQVTGRPAHDPYVRHLALASWVNYGRYAADFMNFGNTDVRDIERQGRDMTRGAPSWETYLEQALQPGRGVILTSAHFGNWDMAGAFVARRIAVSAVVETFSDKRLNTLIQAQRQGQGLNIIPVEGSPRRILRVLLQNQVVGIVVDRPLPPGQGTEISFFGRTTYVPGGPATLAIKTGAAILPGYVWYGPPGEYYVCAFPPLFPQEGAERASEERRLTQGIYDTLEEMVRASPAQWYMFRQFWPASQPEPSELAQSFTTV